jgi:hypothetical protein
MTGRILVVVGVAAVLGWAGLLAAAYAGTYRDEHIMTASPGYLNGAPRDGARQCLIASAGADERRITVPAMPRRGIHLTGIRVDHQVGGEATITCDGPVHFTQGRLVHWYPLIEQWLVLLVGLVVIAAGVYRLGLFRHTSRFP